MELLDADVKKEDYSNQVTTNINEARGLIQNGKFNEAIVLLLALEKKTRIVNDNESTARVIIEIVRVLKEAGDLDELVQQIHTLCRKRGQSKHAIHALIKEGFSYVQSLDSSEVKIKLIETLLSVSEGKIFVEIERARLTKMLCDIKRSMGDVEGACKRLIEVQVETFSSIEVREMTEYLLEQIQLCLECNDLNRAAITGKKVNLKLIKDLMDLKIRYFKVMADIEARREDFLKVAEFYLNLFEIVEPVDQMKCLRNAVFYAIHSPRDCDQRVMLNRINQIRKLESLIKFKQIVDIFLQPEIIDFREFTCTFGDLLYRFEVDNGCQGIAGNKLRLRIIEHNISVIATWYNRVTISRAAEILQLSEEETEEHLTRLVIDRTTWARIDRMNSIVDFRPKERYEAKLNRLSSITLNVMRTVDGVVHQIERDTDFNVA